MVSSRGEEKLLGLLRESFPFTRIVEQHYINYMGQKLYFDFFLPSYDLVIEYQGSQHYGFVEFFHGDNAGWKSGKKRDRLKKEWAEENSMYMFEVNERNFPSNSSELLNMVLEVLEKVVLD